MIHLHGLPFKVPADLRAFTSIMFTVPKPGKVLPRGVLAQGSKRAEVRARQKFINDYMVKKTFLMEDIRTLIAIILVGDWIITMDVTEAYMTIHTHRRYWKLQQFQTYDRDGALQTYRFKVLCYGNTDAPCRDSQFAVRSTAVAWNATGPQVIVDVGCGKGIGALLLSHALLAAQLV